MKKEINPSILQSIGALFEASKACRLSESFFQKNAGSLHLVADYLQVSPVQAFFFSLIFSMNYDSGQVDIQDIVRHLDCNPMRVLEFNNDLEVLQAKGIMKKRRHSRRRQMSGPNDLMYINEVVITAVPKNQTSLDLRKESFQDVIDLLEKLYILGEERSEEHLDLQDLFEQIEQLIKTHRHFPLIKMVYNFHMSQLDTYLYLILIWESLSGNSSLDLERFLRAIMDSPSKKVKYIQQFTSGYHELIQKNLVEMEEGGFLGDKEISLTDYSQELLRECGLSLNKKKRKPSNVMDYEDIPARHLVLNAEEQSQMMLLKKMLGDKQLREIQNRLKGKHMSCGITALLYGAPGTGKTESALQLGRISQRAIMQVDISQAKSMWFGQSEKNIKKLFMDYKQFAEGSERTPILLFNEADAILSKRKDSNSSNVAQTENAIQNILLDELERFDGILIATTNLNSNLDQAFSRRFLFKLEFHKPNATGRAKIWKLKMPFLKQQACNELSQRYLLSGGQIDNIARKSEMFEIVQGNHPELSAICGFCEEENRENRQKKIGFNKNVL